MVNFEGYECSFFQKGYKHPCLPIWRLFCSPLCAQPDPKKSRTPGHTAALGCPQGLSQIDGFSRWIPKLHASAIMPRYKNLDLKGGTSSLLFPAHTADLPPLLFPSFLFPALFLYSFFFFFPRTHCCLQQLLNFTYLGSPLTCCLLEHHIVSRDVGQNQSCHPLSHLQGAISLCQLEEEGEGAHSLQTAPSLHSQPPTGDLCFISSQIILTLLNSKYNLGFW